VTRFVLVNQSAQPVGDLNALAAALTGQLNTDFAPHWNPSEVYLVTADTSVDVTGDPNGCFVYLTDQEIAPGAAGFHTVEEGHAVGYIQVQDCQAPLTLSIVLSHELLETAADWPADKMVPDPAASQTICEEVCDPCEDESYDRDGTAVSNFVLPPWFAQGSGPVDFLGKLSTPFEMSPGGYCVMGDGSQKWGALGARPLKPWRRAMANRKARSP
jgi:hypothetical protein